jgi:hypothetical protein
MKMIARKIGAFTTETKTLLPGTSVNAAGLRHVIERYCPFLITASPTAYLFDRNLHVLGNLRPEPFVLTCQIHRTIPAIQSARRGHLLVIHRTSFDEKTSDYEVRMKPTTLK